MTDPHDRTTVPLVLTHGPTRIELRDTEVIEVLGYLAINANLLWAKAAAWEEWELRVRVKGGTGGTVQATALCLEKIDGPPQRRAGIQRRTT